MRFFYGLHHSKVLTFMMLSPLMTELFFIFRVNVTLGHFIEIRLFLISILFLYILAVERLAVSNSFSVILASEYKFLHGPLSLMDFK